MNIRPIESISVDELIAYMRESPTSGVLERAADIIVQQRAQIKALESQASNDAARYRYLRNKGAKVATGHKLYGEDLDRYIDLAKRAEGETNDDKE